jgi:hypothetical protein
MEIIKDLYIRAHRLRLPSTPSLFLGWGYAPDAFDLLELDGQDLRREPLETRKATLASLLRGSLPGLRLNEHLAHAGESVFRHACKMGLEGIVSKRLGSRYRSGRSKDWLKFKNPAAPAVKRREAEEDWHNGRLRTPPRWESGRGSSF